ncbi:MAG: hypothetical protein M1831_002657 [Alyxoria varia]|nr:MAG: hypothetical protein M1831_002657 [Alyxoria varia]
MNPSQSVRRFAAQRPSLLSLRARSLHPNVNSFPASVQIRLAHQDYGSGAGDPVGENPQEQGANPCEKEEHPGPPPPNVKGGSTSSSGQSQSNQDNPQPKVHAQKTPGNEGDGNVQKHNKEMEQRAAKSHHKESLDEKDKVDKPFWRGEGDA